MAVRLPTEDDLNRILCNPGRLAALNRIGPVGLGADSHFDGIAELLRTSLDADAALVTLVYHHCQVLKGLAGVPEPHATSRELPFGSGISLLTLASRDPVLIADVRGEFNFAGTAELAAFGVVAYAGAPLIDEEGTALGTVCAIVRAPREWSMRDRGVLERFSRFTSAELARSLHVSRDRLESEPSDTTLLQTLSSAMIHEEDVEALYKKFVDAAVQIMGADCASMQMFHPERGESGALRLLASHGFSPEAQEYWKWVDANAGSTCAESLRTHARTVAANLAACDFTERRNDRALFLQAGVHAAQSTPLFSRNGKLLGMITTHWLRPHRPTEHDLRLLDIVARQAADLIERRLAEKALRESEERFRAFVATSSDVVYRMSADWSEMQSLDGRDFITNPSPNRGWIAKNIHPADQARVLAGINEAIATKATFDFEHRVIRADGTLGWTHSRAIPLFDDEGEITEWFGAATDITPKKMAEAKQKEALRESERNVETLQKAFLPQSLPEVASLRIDAAYSPAGEGALVGGDWYDAAQLPDGRIFLCVGDVTGHGLSAAVTAGKLRQAAMVAALTTSDPAEILRIVNRVLRFQRPDVYATAVLAFIDRDCKELCYASAGHPPAFIAANGNAPVIALQCGGTLLGALDGLELTTHRFDLPENFILAFYSDGLTEFARDIAAAEDAIKGVMRAAIEKPPLPHPATEILEGVLGKVRPSDDVVVLCVHRSAKAAECSSVDDAPARKAWRFHSSDESAACEVRSTLTRLTSSLGVDSDTSFAAQIILGEALANAVQHAPGTVEIAIEPLKYDLVMTVRDHGPGMMDDGRQWACELLDESGRGLFLMRALAAQITIRKMEGGGTELRAELPLPLKR